MAGIDVQEYFAWYNGLNQLMQKETEDGITTLAYDAKGNLSSETTGGPSTIYSYNAENHLTSVKVGQSTINSNTYRSDGRRSSKTEGAVTTNYVYQNGSVLYTTDPAGQKTSFNLYSPGGALIASKRYQGTQGDRYLTYIKDIRGSTSSVIDDAADYLLSYDYADFGETTRSGDPDIFNEIAYIGGVHDDSTALYYLNARYYDPVDGRFLTIDPARADAEKGLYAYCAGDPINYLDPFGLAARALDSIRIGAKLSRTERACAYITGALMMAIGGALYQYGGGIIARSGTAYWRSGWRGKKVESYTQKIGRELRSTKSKSKKARIAAGIAVDFIPAAKISKGYTRVRFGVKYGVKAINASKNWNRTKKTVRKYVNKLRRMK